MKCKHKFHFIWTKNEDGDFADDTLVFGCEKCGYCKKVRMRGEEKA